MATTPATVATTTTVPRTPATIIVLFDGGGAAGLLLMPRFGLYMPPCTEAVRVRGAAAERTCVMMLSCMRSPKLEREADDGSGEGATILSVATLSAQPQLQGDAGVDDDDLVVDLADAGDAAALLMNPTKFT